LEGNQEPVFFFFLKKKKAKLACYIDLWNLVTPNTKAEEQCHQRNKYKPNSSKQGRHSTQDTPNLEDYDLIKGSKNFNIIYGLSI
jgi:hypothetical protein